MRITAADLIQNLRDGRYDVTPDNPNASAPLEDLEIRELNEVQLGQILELLEQHRLLNAVQRLNIRDNGLTMLPASIGNLVALQELDLFNNDLTSLPGNIGNLMALKTFFVSSNYLTGLPDSMLNLPALENFHAYNKPLWHIPFDWGIIRWGFKVLPRYLCGDRTRSRFFTSGMPKTLPEFKAHQIAALRNAWEQEGEPTLSLYLPPVLRNMAGEYLGFSSEPHRMLLEHKHAEDPPYEEKEQAEASEVVMHAMPYVDTYESDNEHDELDIQVAIAASLVSLPEHDNVERTEPEEPSERSVVPAVVFTRLLATQEEKRQTMSEALRRRGSKK